MYVFRIKLKYFEHYTRVSGFLFFQIFVKFCYKIPPSLFSRNQSKKISKKIQGCTLSFLKMSGKESQKTGGGVSSVKGTVLSTLANSQNDTIFHAKSERWIYNLPKQKSQEEEKFSDAIRITKAKTTLKSLQFIWNENSNRKSKKCHQESFIFALKIKHKYQNFSVSPLSSDPHYFL